MSDRSRHHPPRPGPQPGKEVREIKTLVNLMNEFGLVELEIEDKNGKVRLVRARPTDLGANPASHAAPVRETAAWRAEGARSGTQRMTAGEDRKSVV